MAIRNVTSAGSAGDASAVKAAVDTVLGDVQKVHRRLTEELRTEDAIRNLSAAGKTVVVTIDERLATASGALDFAKRALADAGLPAGTRVVSQPALENVAERAQKALDAIQGRLTTDLRVEDDIAGFKAVGASIAVLVRADRSYLDADVKSAAVSLLKAAGLNDRAVELQPAAPPVRTPAQQIAAAMAAIDKVKARGFENFVAEDVVISLSLDAAGARVLARENSAMPDAAVVAAVRKHLDAVGFQGAISVVRGSAATTGSGGLNLPPPVAGATTTQTTMAGIKAYLSDVRRIQSRSTEELRAEDAIVDIKLRGALVVVTIDGRSAVAEGAKAVARQGLGAQGVTVPIKFEVQGGGASTMAIPEDGGFGGATTEAVGEEGGGATTAALGEE